MKTAIGAILVFGGLIAMAGSAGDCDGACMENAMSISEILVFTGGGIFMIAMGALGFYALNEE